jgi:hypothetical protein
MPPTGKIIDLLEKVITRSKGKDVGEVVSKFRELAGRNLKKVTPELPSQLLSTKRFNRDNLLSILDRVSERLDLPPNVPQATLRGDALSKAIRDAMEDTPLGPFSRSTTNVSEWDNLFGPRGESIHNVKGISQKEYYAKYKGLSGEVVEMSPTEYLRRIPYGKISQEKLGSLWKAVSEGKEIAMPYLDYTGKTVSQEGRHRAKMAFEMGLEKIPVLIIKKVPEVRR